MIVIVAHSKPATGEMWTGVGIGEGDKHRALLATSQALSMIYSVYHLIIKDISKTREPVKSVHVLIITVNQLIKSLANLIVLTAS